MTIQEIENNPVVRTNFAMDSKKFEFGIFIKLDEEDDTVGVFSDWRGHLFYSAIEDAEFCTGLELCEFTSNLKDKVKFLNGLLAKLGSVDGYDEMVSKKLFSDTSENVCISRRLKNKKLIDLKKQFIVKRDTEYNNICSGIDYEKSELILGVYVNIIGELNKIID